MSTFSSERILTRRCRSVEEGELDWSSSLIPRMGSRVNAALDLVGRSSHTVDFRVVL
jgi:hypothetical protein